MFFIVLEFRNISYVAGWINDMYEDDFRIHGLCLRDPPMWPQVDLCYSIGIRWLQREWGPYLAGWDALVTWNCVIIAAVDMEIVLILCENFSLGLQNGLWLIP